MAFIQRERARTITPGAFHSDDVNNCTLIPAAIGVRRLTPLEVERCQGFEDEWTKWGGDGKLMSDSRRYAMVGNSVVPAIAEWIGRRLVAAATL